MAEAPRDNNNVTVIMGVSSADGTTPTTIYVDPTTHRMLTSAATAAPGGNDTEVQFNDSGTTAGDAGFTYDKTANIATLGGLIIVDDGFVALGTGSDIKILNRSTSLAADAEVTDVIEGTSDHQGVAANSLIISNITNDGDIMMLVSDGGNSLEFLLANADVADLQLGHGMATVNIKTASGALTLNPGGDVVVSKALSVDDTTDSTSGTTGSIHTDGGMGVLLDLFVGNDILLANGGVIGITGNEIITFNSAGTINFSGAAVDVDGAFTASTVVADTTIAGTTITASVGFALGNADYVGITSNETLVFNTAGTIVVTGANLEFPAGGDITFTGTTGTNDIVLTNSLSDALSITDGSADILVIDTSTAGNVITFTAALTISGAVSLDDTTDTTSGTTGSLHTDGGLGVVLALWVGTTVRSVGDLTIGPDTPDDVQPKLQIRADADSDGGGDTTDVLQIVLTPNATPTLATWDITSTQSAGYTFDKKVEVKAGGFTVTAGDLIIGATSANDVQPALKIIGDADSDGAGDTDDTLTLKLTAAADPTAATWDFTSTQSAGYKFDKAVTILGAITVTSGSITGITDLLVVDGGTGASTLTDGGVLIGQGTGAIEAVTMATKGDLLAGDGTTDPQVLGVGTNDQVLTAASGETTGMKWAAAGGGSATTVKSIMPWAIVGNKDLSNANTFSNNTTAKYSLVHLPADITVNAITVVTGVFTAASTMDIGVYTEDGQTQKFAITTASLAVANTAYTTAVSSVLLVAGNYYVVAIPNTDSIDLNMYSLPFSTNITGGFGHPSGDLPYTGTSTESAGTLPTTFTPDSDITLATDANSMGIGVRLDN